MTPDSAIVTAPVTPVRPEADHRTEQVSQWLLGEPLAVLDTRGAWILALGPDGYEGWTATGGVRLCDGPELEGWKRQATLRSLGARYRGEGGIEALTPLPWGARVAPADRRSTPGGVEDGRAVILPDGSRARVMDPDRLLGPGDLARFPAHGAAVVETARQWFGVPYLWGGRTELGVDCSGFVQAVFRLHGIELPRDSGPQSAAYAAIDSKARRPGDLLFFAPEGRGVTHVGIAADESRMVHAAASNGRVAEDDLSPGEGAAARLRDSLVRVTRPLPDPR